MRKSIPQLAGFDHVFFTHPRYAFDDLYEARFLTEVFNWLSTDHRWVFDQFDLVVFADEGTPQQPPRRPGERPAVLLHISDEAFGDTGVTPNEFAAVFRSYLPADIAAGAIAMPLGTAALVDGHPVKAMAQRSTSVFFSGNLHQRRVDLYIALRGWPALLAERPVRRVAAAAIQRVARLEFDHILPDATIRFTTGFGAGLPAADFIARLDDAKIALCPEGAVTNETFRHYEALRAGCVVISPPLPDTWYYRTSPIIQIVDWRMLPELAHTLLEDPDGLQERNVAAQRWWHDVASPRAVARFLAQRVLGP